MYFEIVPCRCAILKWERFYLLFATRRLKRLRGEGRKAGWTLKEWSIRVEHVPLSVLYFWCTNCWCTIFCYLYSGRTLREWSVRVDNVSFVLFWCKHSTCPFDLFNNLFVFLFWRNIARMINHSQTCFLFVCFNFGANTVHFPLKLFVFVPWLEFLTQFVFWWTSTYEEKKKIWDWGTRIRW